VYHRRVSRPFFGTAFVLLVAACSDDDPTANWVAPTGAPAHVTGHAFVFGPNTANLPIEGATVAMTEAPDVATAVTADGTFAFDVPSGGPATFSLTKDGFHPNQSATLDIGADGIAMLGFQTPTEDTFVSLGDIADIHIDATRCQIATTVSRAGTEPYGGDGLGVEGATVAIRPSLPATSSGPIYFAYYLNGTVIPDRSLTETSLDGGLVFANVPVGEYTLTATKAGVAFTQVDVRCRAGVLVNAAPPNGIQQL
jgi:hypothetical protein